MNLLRVSPEYASLHNFFKKVISDKYPRLGSISNIVGAMVVGAGPGTWTLR